MFKYFSDCRGSSGVRDASRHVSLLQPLKPLFAASRVCFVPLVPDLHSRLFVQGLKETYSMCPRGWRVEFLSSFVGTPHCTFPLYLIQTLSSACFGTRSHHDQFRLATHPQKYFSRAAADCTMEIPQTFQSNPSPGPVEQSSGRRRRG